MTELFVQSHLRSGFTYEELAESHGIKSTAHSTLPLVILNYDQIKSIKSDAIVRECRGLVLHSQTHSIVARSFPRFFNWGEMESEADDFVFECCCSQTKEDGSLVLIYCFEGQWMANTRGSFADHLMENQQFTWEEAFLKSMEHCGIDSLQDLSKFLDPRICYVCEFCSPWNKVVRQYNTPQMFLLTAFIDFKELQPDAVDVMCPPFWNRPDTFVFHSIEEVQSFVAYQSETDATFEGIVIRDIDNRRWKIKSPTYLALHRLKGDGDNMFLPKNLIPFILSGETSELLAYFPEVTDKLNECTQIVNAAYRDMITTWEAAKSIESQKEFAQFIIPRTKLGSILFMARKSRTSIDVLWKESTDLLLKVLF